MCLRQSKYCSFFRERHTRTLRVVVEVEQRNNPRNQNGVRAQTRMVAGEKGNMDRGQWRKCSGKKTEETAEW